MTERVMVIAAHPGDEVLGCGGTIARHVADGDEVYVLFVADGETSRTMRALPNWNFMAFEASKVLGTLAPRFLDFNDGRLDQVAFIEIITMIEVHAFLVKPTVVFTHHAGDLDPDRRIVHQAAMMAFRPLPDSTVETIAAFETPSSTEWGVGFAPNHFMDIQGEPMAQKLKALQCYKSLESVLPMARHRGAQCGRYYAEAFMILRNVR
jgi:N-acetylglucosamine malate deacetylase 1